jgi:hypothetical protein
MLRQVLTTFQNRIQTFERAENAEAVKGCVI